MKYGISRGGDDDDDDDDDATPPSNAVTAVQTNQQATAAASPNTSTNANSPVSRPSLGDSSPAVASPAGQTVAFSASDAKAPSSDLPESKPAAAAPEPSGLPTVGGVSSIETRRPASPLEVDERRRTSAENMRELTATIKTWIEQSNVVQTSVIRDSVGRPGLSWRVSILPLLGYEDLYKKFNLKEPWDGPTNKPLLEYIPDVFVSPERFDTNTNYQLFVNGTALFSEKEWKDKTEISDAPTVLLLAEVDDAMAVPWTSPYDYDIREEPLVRGLGNLRDDGVFVGWMTGQAALWPKPINADHLFRAITFEAGDALPFANYMNFPPTVAGGGGRPSLSTQNAAGIVRSSEASQPRANTSPTEISVRHGIRSALPDADDIAAAQKKMRATYEGAFNEARTPGQVAQLAQRIYQDITQGAGRRTSNDDDDDGSAVTAQPINMPPAELFVGLRTALNVATRGGDTRLAIKLLDELDQRYELDRLELATEMAEGFLGKKGSLRRDLNRASPILETLEELVEANIEVDDYKQATIVLEYALPVTRATTDAETRYRWKVLEERIGEGKRLFPRVASYITTLEADPNDANANFTVGWYLCIVKDNWLQGAEMLAKSSDKSLRLLALLEIQDDSDLGRHVELGDGWWDYAESKNDEPLIFEAAMQRSRKWYSSAAVGLPDGLDRIRANHRLNQIDRLIGKAEPIGKAANRSL